MPLSRFLVRVEVELSPSAPSNRCGGSADSRNGFIVGVCCMLAAAQFPATLGVLRPWACDGYCLALGDFSASIISWPNGHRWGFGSSSARMLLLRNRPFSI